MFEKKCPGCGEKIERKFRYCPWCNYSLKKQEVEENFGMLGKDDEVQQAVKQMNLPFGLNGIVGNLMKQIEKEMGDINKLENANVGKPRGFKIQISTGMPKMQMVGPGQNIQLPHGNELIEEIPESERNRRSKLKRVGAKSTIRRLPEGIVYEIEAPGVKSKKDIAITKLEQSIELKAYSKDRCYVKIIPMKVEILGVSVKDDIVFLKLKG